MRLCGRSGGRFPRLRHEAGYTLVEMMIATAVAMIVIGGVYAIFISQRKVSESQKIYNDLQTSCGFAMDQIKRELLLAGYRAQNPTQPVSVAAVDTIAFEYWDERANADPPFDDALYDQHTQVYFKLEANGEVVRKFKRWHSGSNRYQPDTSFATLDAPYRQTLTKNVNSLSLQYFSQNNAVWNPDPDNNPATPPPYNDIRSVIVSLQCRAAKANPLHTNVAAGGVNDKYPEIRLQSEVRLRNIGVDANPRDTQPPATPTQLRAWDPGLCATPGTACVPPTAPACAPLGLAWDANTESDLAGYIIYYGLAANSYSNRVRIAQGPRAAGTRVGYTLTGLQPTTTACGATPVAPATYFIRIEAFDKSGNPSPRSAEISGNPLTSITVESTTGNDTTINPTPPPAPTGFVAGTPADNQIQLSWTAPAVAGLVGFRLYRGGTAAFAPAGRRVGDPGANLLADETTLTAETLTYLDTGLPGCVPVHYKLAAITCDPCLPDAGLAFAAVSGTPTDNTKPSAPKIVARAGFKRVILSLENPVRASEPDFQETRVFFNAVSGACTPGSYPSIAEDGTVSNGRLIPDSGGVFTGEGTLASVNFDHESIEVPAEPNLSASSSYCFLAVAYDRCNNHSDGTGEARTEGLPCGDCLSSEPCYNAPAPPLPTTIATAGCYGSLELTWPHLDPSGSTVRDFTGYRVYRCEDAGTSPCSTTSTIWLDPQWQLLTGADPVWFSKFVDSPDKGLLEGHRYLYRIQATDCYWEQYHDKPASEWPDPANDPNDNAKDSALLTPLSVGRIVRDPSFPLVLSGMLPDTPADWVEYASSREFRISPAFRHNTVLFRLKNATDATLTLKQATISWENATAFLQRIAYGGNNATPVTSAAWLDPAPPLTRSSGSTVAFQAGAEFKPLDDAIPVHLTFKRADGVVDDRVNLRENRLQVGINYRNESTGDESCSMLENVPVPLGPYVYGTTQDSPGAGTMAWPVPGPGGSNAMNAVLVPGQQMVNVYTNIADTSFAGIREARLYYYVDAPKAYVSAPPLVPAARYDENPALDNLAPYQRIDLQPVAGSQWRTPAGSGIPASNDANVWYFIVAVDRNGNFDREPEPDSGAFQYFQRPYDVCYNTPRAPVLTGSYTSSSVTLAWTAPLLNTDGTTWTDAGGYRVYRKNLTSGPVKVAEVGSGTLTYTDSPPNMSTETYSYYVSAFDTCTPVANESSASNWYSECQGAPSCAVNLSAGRTPLWSGNPGDVFAFELNVCARQNGTPGEAIHAQVCSGADANPVRLVEDGDSGVFQIDAGTYLAGTVKTWLALPAGAGNLDLRVNLTDTITVRGFGAAAGAGWDTTCDAALSCAATLNVVQNPCTTAPSTPAAPTITAITRNPDVGCNKLSGTGSSTANQHIALVWPAVAGATYYRIYRCSSSATCTPKTDGAMIGNNVTAASFTDTNLPGQLDQGTYRYSVSAVADPCPSNFAAIEGPASPALTDPCP